MVIGRDQLRVLTPMSLAVINFRLQPCSEVSGGRCKRRIMSLGPGRPLEPQPWLHKNESRWKRPTSSPDPPKDFPDLDYQRTSQASTTDCSPVLGRDELQALTQRVSVSWTATLAPPEWRSSEEASIESWFPKELTRLRLPTLVSY